MFYSSASEKKKYRFYYSENINSSRSRYISVWKKTYNFIRFHFSIFLSFRLPEIYDIKPRLTDCCKIIITVKPRMKMFSSLHPVSSNLLAEMKYKCKVHTRKTCHLKFGITRFPCGKCHFRNSTKRRNGFYERFAKT